MLGHLDLEAPVTAHRGVRRNETDRVLLAEIERDLLAVVAQRGAVADSRDNIGLGAGLARERLQRLGVNSFFFAAAGAQDERTDRNSEPR